MQQTDLILALAFLFAARVSRSALYVLLAVVRTQMKLETSVKTDIGKTSLLS
jgi:hypothetical protein